MTTVSGSHKPLLYTLCAYIVFFLTAGTAQADCANGLAGWHILSETYRESTPGLLQGITFQWDYFMVHDDDFTGSIGYVVADPAAQLVGLMPSGGNTAISGMFLQTGQMRADYVNFGTAQWSGSGSAGYGAAADIREFHGEKDGMYGHITPIPDNESLHLTGRTETFQWDLTVLQDWADRCDDSYAEVFPVMTGWDVGNFPLLPDQHWSVDMNWMRTRVTGTITDLTRVPPARHPIDGHGYREQAWGPWAFNFSGWDFVIVSDNASGVQWSLQTYHHSDTMDYLDVSFYDNGLRAIRFSTREGELGWYHQEWGYDPEARQCVPRDMTVVARNADYTVEAWVEIGDAQVPMLSDLTPVTESYVIVCRFPWISGTITRTGSGAPVAAFSGQGGGEFSVPRRSAKESAEPDAAECAAWGGQFTAPLPVGCIDTDGDGFGYAGSTDCPHSGRDCDDQDPDVNPAQREIAGNGIDDNCDGQTDDLLKKNVRRCALGMFLYNLLTHLF